MAYTHYDLTEIEAMMRQMRADNLPERLASAESAETKIGYLAQDRFFEATVAAQLEMFRLLNEGRDPSFIGKTIGAFVGGLIVNTLAASPDHQVCWSTIKGTMLLSMGVLGDDESPTVSVSFVEVRGTQGGRA